MSHIMNANNKLCDFKQWCQLVLPLVYDDTLSYYEVLDKVVIYLNKTTKSVKSIYPVLDEIIKELSDMQETLDNLDSIVDEKVNEYLNSPEFLNRLRTLTLQWVDEALIPIRETIATKADISDIPTKTSELTNDSDFITGADVPTKTSELTNDSNFVSDANYVHTDNNFSNSDKSKLDGIENGAEVNVQSDWNVSDSSSDAFIKNKPTIPSKTSDLVNDSGFITDADVPVIDDTETTSNNVWSALKTSSELAGKVSDSNYVHTDNNFTNADKTKLDGIASGAEVNVQSDWNESDSNSDAFIKNKPTIPDISTKVNKTGDTMTGNLTLKVTNVDASKANNNVSSTQYPTTFNITDTSSRIITRNECIVESNGNIGSYWYTRNYNTSGGVVAQKGLKMTMNKSGALSWSVDDAANFRSAIGLYYEEQNGASNCCSSNNTNVQHIKCIRIGKMVTLTFFFSNSTAQTGSIGWVALKSQFRPATQIFFPVNIIGNSNAYSNESCHRMYLYADGSMILRIDNTNATVSQVMGSVSYCIN